MQTKSKQTWPESHTSLEEAKSLLEQFNRLKPKQEDISKATGVNQGQVSRILRGQFSRLDGHAQSVCKYAKNHLASRGSVAVAWQQRLVDSALSLWDGSEGSAERTIVLLEALKPLVRAGKD